MGERGDGVPEYYQSVGVRNVVTTIEREVVLAKAQRLI